MHNTTYTYSTCLSALLFCTLMSFSPSANSKDQTYEQLLTQLKQASQKVLSATSQVHHLETQLKTCQLEVDVMNSQYQSLLKEREVTNVNNATQQDEFEELKRLAIEQKLTRQREAIAHCEAVIKNTPPQLEQLARLQKTSNHDVNTAKEKLIEYLIQDKKVSGKTVSQSIRYECEGNSKQKCLQLAKVQAIRELGEKTGVELTSTSKMKNFMLADDTVVMTATTEFSSIKIDKQAYDNTLGVLDITMSATYDSQYAAEQEQLDRIKLESVLDNFLDKLYESEQ